MRTIFARKRTMQTAADFMQQAQPRLDGLVGRATRASGSRMHAYSDVARGIGTSASWVRKMLRGEPVALHAHTFANIMARYDEACARIEHEAAIERERFYALGRVADAVASGADRPSGVETGPDAARGRPTIAVVAPLVDADRQRLSADRKMRGRA